MLADRIRRTLDVEAVIISSRSARGRGERVVAATGSAPNIDASARSALCRNELLLSATRSDAAPFVESSCLDGGTKWVSVGLRGSSDCNVALHLRCPADWQLDRRVRQMLPILGARVASAITCSEQPRTPVDAELAAAGLTLTTLALSVETFDEVVGGITATIAPLVDAAKAGVAIWHDERGYLEMLPGSFGASDEVVASSRVFGSEMRSLAARVVTSGRALFTNRAAMELPLFREHFAAMGVTRMLTLPISAPGRTIGVLHVANKRAEFDDSDIRRLEPLMPFVAALVEHVRDRLDLREREALAAVVSRAATAVAAGQPLANFWVYLEDFCFALRARRLAISFKDGRSPIVVCNGAVGSAMESQFLVHSAQSPNALRTSMAAPRAAGDAGWSALDTPVRIAGERKATLSLLRTPYEPFVEHERGTVGRLANVTALALATEHLHRERARIVRLREREVIADELHDDVAQILFSAQLTLRPVVEGLNNDAPLMLPLARACDLLARSQNSLREVMGKLTTPAPASMAARLAAVVQRVEDEFDTMIDLEVAPKRLELAESATEMAASAALGAAREGMINAAKHGGAGRIWVSMRVTSRSRLVIAVDDDGVGLVRIRQPEGYGLRSVRRKLRGHGGILRMGSSIHGGARFLVSLPLAKTRISGSAQR